MRHAGIDVSKSTLSVALLDGEWEAELPNTEAGIQRLVKRLGTMPTRVAIEATASYGFDLVDALAQTDDVEVMVINPRASRNFAKATRRRGKTDRGDSHVLARFASAMEFTPWTAPSPQARELRQLVRRRKQLVDQAASEKRRRKELLSLQRPDAFVIETLDANLEHLRKLIARVEAKALQSAKTDPELDAWRQQLVTTPGIADVTALCIIAELAFLPDNMDGRQLTAYAGLDPQPWQSGQMDASRRISKRGNKRLRCALFLAAWNTARFSPHVGAWRDRLLARGKHAKVADIAVARRLLHAFAAMRKRGTPWDGDTFHRISP
ncbi:MAG: IS110 family transposase [Myxococcota bacterium]